MISGEFQLFVALFVGLANVKLQDSWRDSIPVFMGKNWLKLVIWQNNGLAVYFRGLWDVVVSWDVVVEAWVFVCMKNHILLKNCIF